MATVTGDGSDNSLSGTGAADEITGGAGNDTISGRGGDDLILGGDVTLSTTDLFLDWTDQGGVGTDLSGGFTQDTGGINVGVTLTNNGAGTSATVRTDTTPVASGEPFDPNSGLGLIGSGGPDVWTTTLDFSAVPGSGLADTVENVTFRIQDVDAAGWQDIITVLAFDADGNPVSVTLTPAGDDIVNGNTITAAPGSSTAASDPLGSVLVTIPGPVSQVQIIYENGGTAGQLLLVSDVHFEAIPTDDDVIDAGSGNDTVDGGFGDDSVDGGSGNDSLIGGRGNDTLNGEAGADTLEGGEGNDLLDGGGSADSLSGGTGDDTLIGGAGNDTLDGGDGSNLLQGGDGIDQITAQGGDTIDGGEGGNDSADTLIVNDVDRVEFDPLNSENGTVFFNDGTTATFTNIETLMVNGGPDGIVQGTSQNDLIDESFVDLNQEQVDNNDGILGTTGDQDVIEAGRGDDTVFAGQGDDTVIGGPDTVAAPSPENLSWVAEGAGGAATGTFVQNTGIANLTVSVVDQGALSGATFEADPQFVGTGEPFDPNSALVLTGSGGANVATVSVASDTPLENVSFRLNDIDSGTWQDIVTINAFDVDGNPVAVTITPSGDDTVSGNTITAGGVNDAPTGANGSVLVEIAGPISSFEVIYDNGSTGGQLVYLTDVHFTAVQSDDDLIHGDQGSDSLLGAAGDDTIFGDQLALDPTTVPSGVAGTPSTFTFDNQSPFAVQLAQIDGAGNVVPLITVPAGSNFAPPSTTQTNWAVLDPETGDILDLYLAPPDGSVQVFDSQAADTLDGGVGNDVLSGDIGNDSLLGGAGDDTLLGGSGSDTLDGGADNDSLDGGSGADTLLTGAGNDTLVGGDDADRIVFTDGFGSDIIDGSEGGTDQDVLDFSGLSSGVTATFTGDEAGTLSSGGDNATFSNIEEIVGSNQADIINASLSNAPQTISGGDGADIITGGSAGDSLDGGAGTDTVIGGAGADSINGGDGNDSLVGGAGNDELVGGDGDDIIDGGDDADTIFAGSGDVIDGGEGGDDNDELIIDNFQVTIDFDPGNAENGTITFSDGTTATFSNIENVVLTCFTPGTRITTLQGRIPVEDLQVGQQVLTRDSGYQPIRWIGRRDLGRDEMARNPQFWPILIRKDAIAPGVPDRDMRVSPQHRMMIDTLAAQYWLGQDEVLVKAKDMVHKPGIEREEVAEESYIHIMFDSHEIVLADNAWSESFQPGDAVGDPVNSEIFAELLALFPELARDDIRAGYLSARHALTAHEARLVV